MATRLLLTAVAVGAAFNVANASTLGADRGAALLQTWDGASSGAGGQVEDTPVTRVVNLLKEMTKTLKTEMEEDEALYHKLGCWCNDNVYAKEGAIEEGKAKISELESTIESLTAKTAGLKSTLEELDKELSSDKAALSEATALREKQVKEFHGGELDSIQAIENMKAALTVLEKHSKSPDSSVAGGPIFKTPEDQWSLLSVSRSTKKEDPWLEKDELFHADRSLGNFLRRSGLDDPVAPVAEEAVAARRGFLQESARAPSAGPSAGWSAEDAALVKRAMGSAAAFVQAHHEQGYYPAYNSQSGEIVGVLKQLKEEMETDLAEAQKTEQARAAAFEELRAAKSEEIATGERMSEEKEDELATASNELAEAKEDLEQESAVLEEAQTFLKNVGTTCKEAETNFEKRKAERMEEMQAVSETIEILTGEEARDAMSTTYSFVQRASSSRSLAARRQAAAALRRAALRARDPELALLATSVELDAFTKVKKAIDDMMGMLKVQEEDEVKKNDFCKAEIQENEMQTAKTQDHTADLEAKSSVLSEKVKTLTEEIVATEAQIAELQVSMQRASEDRRAANIEFQTTISDQTVTIQVLHKALERLATFYDKEDLLQLARHKEEHAAVQTPPVPQMNYKKSQGAGGVMQMIEKLIQEAKAMVEDSKKAEAEAQAAYEQMVADTNASVAALQKEASDKAKAKASAEKEKLQTEGDVGDATKELEGLAAYSAKIHGECDYLLKNFVTRQEARGAEIEALQQAKQILSGASP